MALFIIYSVDSIRASGIQHEYILSVRYRGITLLKHYKTNKTVMIHTKVSYTKASVWAYGPWVDRKVYKALVEDLLCSVVSH